VLGRFFAWLRRLFGLAETREVLRLEARDDGDDDAPKPRTGKVDGGKLRTDVVKEKVTRKGPLRPKHRRLVLRDERLMPKPPRAQYWEKPKKVMQVDEAGRLFASTLRTTNRDARTLLPDEAQLKRYGLPLWRTEEELAEGLGLSVNQLRHFSIHRAKERTPHYVTYEIAKRSGGKRLIHAPKKRLKAILQKVLHELVEKLPVSEHAHGFVKGRSVKTGAAPHVGKKVVLRLDLQDFFPTVTHVRVRGLLIALGYGFVVAATLAVLVTESARQAVEVEDDEHPEDETVVFHVPVGPRTCVQGAPTSPGICNAILLRMDRRLAAIAHKKGFVYTRYADDLSFSGDSMKDAHWLRRAAARIIEEEGFRVNEAKTRVMGRGGRQIVTGVVVNEALGVPRRDRRKLRAMLHQAATKGADEAREAELTGRLAWVQMVNPGQAAALRKMRG
jgi:RNA-directed DNA polymerase